MTLPSVPTNNPFVKIPYAGDHIDYNELAIEFAVDENLQNYLEIHNWLKALGKPDDFGEYATLAQVPQYTGLGLKSDAVLMILDQKKLPNFIINFEDSFPTALSNIDFDVRDTEVRYLTASAVFVYTKFDLISVKGGDVSSYVAPFEFVDKVRLKSNPQTGNFGIKPVSTVG